MKYSLLKLATPLLFSVVFAQHPIDFIQIENLIIEHNYELKALEKSVESFKGNVHQNSLIPNPEVEFESINGEGTESSATINQTIELGRKRKKRTKIAELELEKIYLSLDNKKLRILNGAQLEFINILLAQKLIKIKEKSVNVAEVFLKSVQDRVSAGSLSPAEENRAQIAYATFLIELNRSKRDINNNWQSLSSYWGSSFDNYTIAIGDLDLLQLPIENLNNPDITRSPLILKKNIEIEIQEAIIESERAERVPDITFSAGLNKYNGEENAYKAGFSIPLKVFDRNQGSIQMNNSKMDQLIEEKNALEIEIKSELFTKYSDLILIDNEIETFQTIIIPEAKKAYQIINDGYLRGKYNFLEVVDSQRTLYKSEENYWRAIADFNIIVTEIELLLGQPFKTLNTIN